MREAETSWIVLQRMTEAQRKRYRNFKLITACFAPHVVASTLRTLTPGVDWTGSGKEAMARAFAVGEHNLTVSIDDLEETLRAYIERHYLERRCP